MPSAVSFPKFSEASSAVINTASSGDNTIVAGVAGQTIRVLEMMLTAHAATNLTFKDGSTALTGAMELTAAGASFNFFIVCNGAPHFITSKGNNFVINNSNAVQLSGYILFTQS